MAGIRFGERVGLAIGAWEMRSFCWIEDCLVLLLESGCSEIDG